MAFFFYAVGFGLVGRKLGWLLSRAVLYKAGGIVVLILCAVWGIAVAGGMRGLLNWQHPGAALRWIMGYALGAYVAVPNYGLVAEASIAFDQLPRHNVIKNMPLIVYAAAAVTFAFTFPY